jgi:RNA polymerase sigma factor (sigma-70 family)
VKRLSAQELGVVASKSAERAYPQDCSSDSRTLTVYSPTSAKRLPKKAARVADRMKPERELETAGAEQSEPLIPWGIESLFREHNDSLLRFLRARLNSDADAREAAQESYVRMLQLDQPDQPSFLRAYLFKVAANVATDIIRQRRVRRPSASEKEVPQAVPAMQERTLAAKQQLRTVQTALDQLPPRCREAFFLSRHDGLSSLEIAARLSVSDRMVRNYLIRALEHVRSALELEHPK